MEERLGIVTVLLLGGLDTTRGMIVHIAHHLATRPDVEAVLRRPNWWQTALDEFLRHQTTVSFMARTVTQETPLGGVALNPGDRLAVHFYSANRDASRFGPVVRPAPPAERGLRSGRAPLSRAELRLLPLTFDRR